MKILSQDNTVSQDVYHSYALKLKLSKIVTISANMNYKILSSLQQSVQQNTQN